MQHVLVTGASTGIGRATVEELDRRGFGVFAGVRRLADVESLRVACSERVRPLMLDVLDSGAIDSAVMTVTRDAGSDGLQGLVNNAGITLPAFLEHIDLADLRRQLEVNVVGVAAITKAFLPLVRVGGGRIVNVGSLAGFFAAPMNGPYAASKFALEGMTDALRRELQPWGLRVSIVEPGVVATPIWKKTEEHCNALKRALPEVGVQRYGPWFGFIDHFIKQSSGHAIPAEQVAHAVHHALTARRPRIRYRVGRDARLMRWVSRVMPDRILDAVVARTWAAARQ